MGVSCVWVPVIAVSNSFCRNSTTHWHRGTQEPRSYGGTMPRWKSDHYLVTISIFELKATSMDKKVSIFLPLQKRWKWQTTQDRAVKVAVGNTWMGYCSAGIFFAQSFRMRALPKHVTPNNCYIKAMNDYREKTCLWIRFGTESLQSRRRTVSLVSSGSPGRRVCMLSYVLRKLIRLIRRCGHQCFSGRECVWCHIDSGLWGFWDCLFACWWK